MQDFIKKHQGVNHRSLSLKELTEELLAVADVELNSSLPNTEDLLFYTTWLTLGSACSKL